jgi:hypothetical protein
MKKTIVILLAMLGGVAAAQPSDSQVKKDMSGGAVLSVKLSSVPGRVQGNTDTMNYEYVRGVEILSKTDYPGIKMKTVGTAVYQRVGKGKFAYWKFRTLEQTYEGIPNPKQDEIEKVLDTDRASVFGDGLGGLITKVRKPPVLAKEPLWTWHTPNSVSFQMVGEIEMPTSNTEIETFEQQVEIRLYRDDMKLPWKSFMASHGEKKSLGVTKYSDDEVRNMPRLRAQIADGASKAKLAKLPKVDVPDFASHDELATYLHQILREGPRDKAEAVIRQLLAPRFYQPGTSMLSDEAERTLQSNLDKAFGDKSSYAQQYCAKPVTENRGAKNRTYFMGVREDLITSLATTLAGGGYKDGVKVGERRVIEELAVRTKTDADTLAWLSSFSDRKKMCPND